ncbi:hypothetical protein G4G27_06995 [Sphingomonas sp. So64.6b]|uniref:hypothetical protein n=1 Tax=Sphingomonas sp. So64.6b TaxID=2997354 RepID=UPI0016005BE6|nr:hypothetical protein [Sphingomonas sp. So64.6b]QNA82561.1 hypothetical protein G4G27_06995 [Sphingomonas sp. So64.6b]
MFKLSIAALAFVAIAATPALARGSHSYGGGRVHYAGSTHTSSHGGHFAGSYRGSSHKGGHYRNVRTSNRYGYHKSR